MKQDHIYYRTEGKKMEAWDGGRTEDGQGRIWVLAENGEHCIESRGYVALRTKRTRRPDHTGANAFRFVTRTKATIMFYGGYALLVTLDEREYMGGEMETLRAILRDIAAGRMAIMAEMDLESAGRRKGISESDLFMARYGDNPIRQLYKLVYGEETRTVDEIIRSA